MGKQYQDISPKHIDFISQQKLFFVGTATADSRINISPKGTDLLRVLSSERALWLNLTGSGNETSAHVQETPRMTLMFCAFSGEPKTLRLYGQAKVFHPYDAEWDELASHFPATPSARQIFDLSVDLVQTSCGFGVPLYDYQGERSQMQQWAEKKAAAGIAKYWEDRNQLSIDGKPTHVLRKKPAS